MEIEATFFHLRTIHQLMQFKSQILTFRLPSLVLASERVRIPQLLKALLQGDATERLVAIREIGDIALREKKRIPEVVLPLLDLLRSDVQSNIREEAAWTLWKLEDERAIRPLMTALIEDPSPSVRERAARSLGLLGACESLGLLQSLLMMGRMIPGRVRAGLSAALGLLGDEANVPLLLHAVSDPEPDVRCEALRALGRYLMTTPGRMGKKIRRALLRHLSHRREPLPRVRHAAIRALCFSGDKELISSVASRIIIDPHPPTRELIAEMIPVANDPRIEAKLMAALEDPHWGVRKAVVRALATFVRQHGASRPGAVSTAFLLMLRIFPQKSCERELAQAMLTLFSLKSVDVPSVLGHTGTLRT